MLYNIRDIKEKIMSECTHNCDTCKDGSCKDRKSMLVTPNKTTEIGKIIAVVSGKGGVGKSLVTSMLAVNASNRGLKTAIMDADVTGPSIPRCFGVDGIKRAQGSEEGLIPVESDGGIKIMSINLLLDEPTRPVIWRGPVISAVVQQFYTDVLWKKNDVMFIDMPPGTSDVPLTVFQSLPIDGVIIVATPQDLVGMIVEKSVNMAKTMNIPIVGVIENMSYYVCPKCGEKEYIFGKGKVKEAAEKYGVPFLAEIPIDPSNRKLTDDGEIDKADVSVLDTAIDAIMKLNKRG